MGYGHAQMMNRRITLARVIGTTFIGHPTQMCGCVGYFRQQFFENNTEAEYVIGRIGRRQLFALVKTDINKLEITDVLSKYHRFGTNGKVHNVIALDIINGINKIVTHLVKVMLCHFLFGDEFAQCVTVDIIGDDTHPKPGTSS